MRHIKAIGHCASMLLAVLLSSALVSAVQAEGANKPPAPHRANLATTQLLIGLPRPVTYRAYTLTNPDRLIVDLPEISIELPAKDQFPAAGLIDDYRYGLVAKGKARLIVDTKQAVYITSSEVIPAANGQPAQLALEIAPSSVKSTKINFNRSGLGISDVGQNSGRSGTPIIVIDAGHGGMDNGANRNGINEADVVLAFAQALRDRLVKFGKYRVIMTRDKDVLIKLSRRAEIAKENRADLFISVHADYVSKSASRVRGATIYTLKPSTARRLAKRGGRKVRRRKKTASAHASSSAVNAILDDLEKRWIFGSGERSTMLVDSLVEFMGDVTKLKPDPHRTANFRVLKSVHVPSVLIELAYVSNKQDAALLNSKKWRSKVTDSVVSALENYFGNSSVRLPL